MSKLQTFSRLREKLPRSGRTRALFFTAMWRIDHHTADVRIHIVADTLRDLFADGVRALTAVMEPEGSTSRRDIVFGVTLEAADSTALLVDFLNAALTASHIHRVAFTDVNYQSFEPTKLAATLIGQKVRGVGEDVKSVTYQAKFAAASTDSSSAYASSALVCAKKP